MKKFTLIQGQHGANGYAEDDWQIITEIHNEHELLNALKEGYKMDSHRRNDYPIISFEPDSVIMTYDDLSQYNHVGSLHHRDLRSYNKNLLTDEDKEIYKIAFDKYDKWKKRIKTLVPKIRKKAKEIETRNNELSRLFELAEKYEFNLVKKVQ